MPSRTLSHDAAVQIALASAEGQLPDVVEDRYMPGVVFGIAPALLQVAGIARENMRPDGPPRGSTAIVHGMGPGVGALHLESMAHAVGELGLQPVVNGIEFVDVDTQVAATRCCSPR